MFKYRHDYKYLQLKINMLNIIIELSKDNTFGEMTYSAKTNVMFQDEYGDWGHAVGVGQTEKDALDMCINEIRDYVKQNFSLQFKNVSIPQKFVYDFKNNIIVLNINENNGEYTILTPNGSKNIGKVNIVETINKRAKEFSQYNVPEYSKELFEQFGFKKTFDALTEKYPPDENCQSL